MLVHTLLLFGYYSSAQTVSPVIGDYKGGAEGMVALTNNTLSPLIAVLEPHSFSIARDGSGVYRALDPKIHMKLSSTSARINPGQTYYIFYEAKADKLPAWFTIFSTFRAVTNTPGPDFRVTLPHTVYIYPKNPRSKSEVLEVMQAAYSKRASKIICEVANNTGDLERVEEIRVVSHTKTIRSAGFPLLPGARRHLELDWKGKDPPQVIVLCTDRSTTKRQLSIVD